MNWLSEEELVKRLAPLAEVEPRQEFVDGLEELLVKKARQLKRKKQFQRFSLQGGAVAAAALLAFMLINASDPKIKQQALDAVEPKPSQSPVTPSLQEEPLTLPKQEATQQQPQQRTKQTLPNQQAIDSSNITPAAPPADAIAAVQQADQGTAEGDSRYANIKMIATSYLEQAMGAEAAKSFQVNDLLSSYHADYSDVVFTRMINGVPYLGETYRIGIDKAGEPASMSINTSKEFTVPIESFPDPAKAISQAEAEKIFAQHLQLVYVERQVLKRSPFYGEPAQSGPVMQYIPKMSYIDALAGKPVDPTGKLGPAAMIPVTGKGEKLIARSPEEAAQLLANAFQLEVNPASIETAAQSPKDQQRYVWGGGIMTVSQKTGQVISLQLNETASRSSGANLSTEKAEEAALQFLQEYLNPAVRELMREEIKEEKGSLLHFRFVKSHQGIPVIDHHYEVTVDRNSGQVVSLAGEFDRAPVALPDKEKAVSANTAAAMYVKEYPLSLAYVWPTINGQKTESPYLVYTQLKKKSDVIYMDAASGSFVNTVRK